jgi:hypothetical protein
MNWIRFFTGFQSITGAVTGLLTIISICCQPRTLAFAYPGGLVPQIQCPELFQVLNTELMVPVGYWQNICSGSPTNSRGDDESGSGSGDDESGSGSGDDESGSGSGDDESGNSFCAFVCNNYHQGCRDLSNYIFTDTKRARRIGCSKQEFLTVCIGWQEYIRETNHNTTVGTTTSPRTTTNSNPSTTTTWDPDKDNATQKENTNHRPWDIGILTTLGLAISAAGGVAIYFWRKRL